MTTSCEIWQGKPSYCIHIPGEPAPDYWLTIPGRLPGLNEYTDGNRTNRHQGATMKRNAQQLVEWCIQAQMPRKRIEQPVFLLYTFYEQDRRRDRDNVSSFARKVIQDALVSRGILANDGWDQITGYFDRFKVDSEHPRIEVEFILQEVKTNARANKARNAGSKSRGK